MKKGDIIAFLIGAILFSGIGIVVATGLSSDSVDFVTSKNNNVLTVKDALDDLYTKTWKAQYYEDNGYIDPNAINLDGVGGELSFVYWNDNFSLTGYYNKNSIPSITYNSRELLEQNYSSFATKPIYVKTTIAGNSVLGHELCLWYNNHEFCVGPNFWVQNDSDGNLTKSKLKSLVETSLNVTLNDNDFVWGNGAVEYPLDNYYISVSSMGYAYISIISTYDLCSLDDSGITSCEYDD